MIKLKDTVSWKHHVVLIVLFAARGENTSTITLSPAKAYVAENASIVLTCSKINGHMSESKWTNSQIKHKSASLAYVNEKCLMNSFLEWKDFTGVCNRNGTYSVRLERIDKSQNGATWHCAEGYDQSNPVTIYISVPVVSVDIFLPNANYLKENKVHLMKCKPSVCRPQPAISWYLQNPVNHTKYNITNNSSQTNTQLNDGLISAESTMNIVSSRLINGWILLCEAWNDGKDYAVTEQIYLNVSYPPDSEPVINGYESGKIYRFIELDHINFTCSVTGGNPLATLNWTCSSTKSVSLMLENKTVVSYVTLRVQRYQTLCSCESYHIVNGKRVTHVRLDVLYPPTKPQFVIRTRYVSRVVYVIRNNSLNVTCVSRSNPSPTYTWTGVDIPHKVEQTLIASTSNINIERQYRCTAVNKMVRSDNTYMIANGSSSMTVKVLYPPGKPIFRYGGSDGHTIKLDSIYVVKGTTFSIYCNANGYPSPDIVWDNITTGYLLNILSITSDANRTCTATNRMNETVGQSLIGSISSTLSLIVLYPPEVPTITVSTKNDKVTSSGHIDIIETATVELECYTKSRPTPSYKWIINARNDALQRNILKLTNISRTNAGNYTCHANNVMNRTVGEAIAGKSSSSTLINILYSGEVGPLSDISIKETSILNITCPVIPGNPSMAEIFWSRKSDNKNWNGANLIILNVSRTDDTDYICTVSSEMNPTVGTVTKTEKSGKFNLNVFYSAVVKTFSLIGGDFVVNQSEKVSFVCTVEANPASDITIVSPQRERIIMQSNTNNVSHTFQNVSCENAGEYICTGKNNYTIGEESSSKLILIVRCPPRPLTDSTNDEKIATSKHVEVILRFTARDYLDIPNKTTFMWFKDNVALESGSTFGISSNGLQSILSIKNITLAEFGQYDVRVSNSVGQYVHVYNVMPKGKPEVPYGFAYIDDSITDSSVSLKWMPGFDGGYSQSFILLYKRKTEEYWQHKSVTDKGTKHMAYNLSGLFSEMEYQVKIFARNEVGDSAFTDILEFRTNASVKTPVESHSSSKVGVVAGSVSSCVVIVAVIIVVVLVHKKRLKRIDNQNVRKTTRTAFVTESSFTYDGLDMSKREGDTYSQLPAAYEQLDNITKDESTYMKKENTNANREDPDYINIRI